MEKVSEISAAAQRATKLTRQLLAFGRKQVIEPQLVDINKLVVVAKNMLDRLIAENIEHIFNSEESLKKVFVDPSQIEQILTNLCINARDAMPGGGKLFISTENITVDSRNETNPRAKSGQYVVIRVKDTGSGMTDEVAARVFEPFFTTKPMGKGTGLGLSVVQGIVDQHGGFVQLDTKPGVGSCFSIFLPVATEKHNAEVVPPKTPRTNGTEKVLVVEDDERVRQITTHYLETAGYQTVSASNGIEGLETYRRDKPDLVLTDLVMPEMGGVEMMKQILQQDRDTSYIYMSGYIGSELDVDFLLDQEQEFIPKPYSAKMLLYKVRSVLDAANRHRDLEHSSVP